MVGLSTVLTLVVWLHWQLPHVGTRFSFGSSTSGNDEHRLALIVPLIGQGVHSIPPYLNLFCYGAAGIGSVADVLIFHNGFLSSNVPEHCRLATNVRFITLDSTLHLAQTILDGLLQHKSTDDLQLDRYKADRVLAWHLGQHPYALIEFKPALGTIFASYIRDYSHWGYTDLDLLFGDLPRWWDEWKQDWDVVTYGFGDQHRLYLRGQFTFHRNTDKVNTIWRNCTHLSDWDVRFAKIVQQQEDLRVESAEGCYSEAVLLRDDLRVQYVTKAWTDIDVADTAYSHGIYSSRGRDGRHVIYKAENASMGKQLRELEANWYERNDRYRHPGPFYQALGPKQQIDLPDDKHAKCMYWARKTFQRHLCLPEKEIAPTDAIYWIHGKLYKQSFEKLPLPVDTAPFFHFQEWKRRFRTTQLSAIQPDLDRFVLGPEGVLPIHPSPHTRFRGPRSELPTHTYCLVSEPRSNPSRAGCAFAVSWQDAHVVSTAPAWSTVDPQADVTLALTLELTPDHWNDRVLYDVVMDHVRKTVVRWKTAPIVLVVYVGTEHSDALLSRLRRALDGTSQYAFVALVFAKERYVSRKALLNMAADAAPTRWLVSGLELERGLTLSQGSVFWVHRLARLYQNYNRHVFWIPQFALDGTGDKWGWPALEKWHRHHAVVMRPAHFKEPCDEGPGEHLDVLDEVWWSETLALKEVNPESNVTALDALNRRILSLLLDEMEPQEVLYRLDESPILLMDAWDLARAVEELAGRRCYNGLQLAQLAGLGYRFGVVPGAFAISSNETRVLNEHIQPAKEAELGPSRCYGCYQFHNQQLIVDKIVQEEIQRVVKTTLL